MRRIFNILMPVAFVGLLFSQTQLPVINSVTPLSGLVNTNVQINGYYFYFEDEQLSPSKKRDPKINVPPLWWCRVYFGSTEVYPTYLSTTRINFNVPNVPAGNYSIKVTNYNGSTFAPNNFTVTIPPPPPIKDIAFVHGYNNSSANWYSTPQTLYNLFKLNTYTNNSYDATIALSSSAASYASTVVPYSNSVVVAHSMGGLVSREIKRQQGAGSKVRALITIGTPHTGAPIAINSTANLSYFLNVWLNYDLATPWLMLGESSSFIQVILEIIIRAYDDIFNFTTPWGLNSAAAIDMRPGSAFLNSLNTNFSASLPAAHYAIYGVEDWNSHWRFADAAGNDGIETGNILSYVYDVADVYYTSGVVAAGEADYYYLMWEMYGDPEDYYTYYWYSNLAGAFFNGYNSIVYYQQVEWNQYLVGEAISTSPTLSTVNDAFIPTYSAAPSFITSERTIRTEHTNHAEETRNNEILNKIRQTLRSQDINLEPRIWQE
ncbi:MAG: IPT/TIG domain-containing protein [Bacteroidota bacterium]